MPYLSKAFLVQATALPLLNGAGVRAVSPRVAYAAFTCWNSQSFHLLTLSFTVPCGWLQRLTAAIGYYNTLSQSVPGFEQADLAELKKLS